jgi:hypothetical protein
MVVQGKSCARSRHCDEPSVIIVRQLRAEGKEEAVVDERNLILDEGVEGFEMGMIGDQ